MYNDIPIKTSEYWTVNFVPDLDYSQLFPNIQSKFLLQLSFSRELYIIKCIENWNNDIDDW